MDNILNKNISYLNIDDTIIDICNNNDIFKIKDLCNLKRKDLKNINLSDKDINKITIKLQLLGLDLNNKIYNKL